MKEMILQKCNFRCRENIYICRPLRRLRRLAVEYVKKGAHILKARHPYVLFVTFVSFLCNKSRSGLADRRPVLPGTYKSIKRVKYIGAWLFKILYTNINNLKTILSLIGNQWRSYNIGVISSLFFFTLIKQAAEFWMAWSFLISFSGQPYKILE